MQEQADDARRTWIFQANPERFSIPEMLTYASAEEPTPWAVTRYADRIRPGDRMLLWEAGRDAGVLALATITSDVYVLEEADDFGDTKVDFVITDLVRPRLRRQDLLDHAVLKDLQILRVPNATNFLVTDEQWLALRDLANTVPLETSDEEWVDEAWSDQEWSDEFERRGHGSSVDGRGRPEGAGRRAGAAARRAIELRAVEIVAKMLTERGYAVEDVGARKSFDLLATRPDGEVLEVEVKGTTGVGSTVQLTRNEVSRAGQRGEAALAIVAGIQLSGTDAAPEAAGGALRWFHPWTPAEDDLTPVAFTYRVSPEPSTLPRSGEEGMGAAA